jgi:hypothetical protein
MMVRSKKPPKRHVRGRTRPKRWRTCNFGTLPLVFRSNETEMKVWVPEGRKLRGIPFGIISIVSTVYIAIDALGWTAYIPTHSEMIVWHASICLFAASSMLFPIALLLASFGRNATLTFLTLSAAFLGAVARTMLTIEAFISIRSLPVGAYSTPSWSDVIPHFG